MSSKVRILLVGIGGYGSVYVNELLNKKDCRTEIAGMVDPYPSACKKLDELLATGAKLYNSMEEFYACESADLAVICTPIQFHTQNILCAFSHGSNVLCEKPLCGDEKDIDKIIKARDEAVKLLYIGFQWSFSKAVSALKKDILSGMYGEPEFLKTLVLWPRDSAYFHRGIGWAGKIKAADGSLIYDSVANNAAAHYLHNMLFVLGKSMNSSAMPDTIKAQLYRANKIENFDTCVIECGMNGGARLMFVASHAIDKNLNPLFDYRFTKGRITFTQDSLPGMSEAGNITGKLDDGRTVNYGNPFADVCNKLWYAIDELLTGRDNCLCTAETATPHVRCIGRIQRENDIHSFEEDKLVTDEKGLTYLPGLYEKLVEIYENGGGSIED